MLRRRRKPDEVDAVVFKLQNVPESFGLGAISSVLWKVRLQLLLVLSLAEFESMRENLLYIRAGVRLLKPD